MVNFKELLLYAIMAIVVVFIVVFVLSKGLVGGSYSVNLTLTRVGQPATFPYQTEHYVVNVTNTGRTPITNLLVGFYLDGVSESTNTISLPAGSTITLIRNYTYPTPGQYSFQAVADPSHILNLENRQNTQASINTNISQPQLQDVFVSIPNNNIKSLQTFTFSNAQGVISAVALGQRYNVSLVNRFFGPSETISTSIFENAYQGTADVYGVYAAYTNNTIAYTAWMQGTINPQIVAEVIASYGVNVKQLNVSTGSIAFAPINKNTSMCAYYNGGWTKLISYFNNSLPGTCANIATTVYAPTESAALANVVVQDKNLTKYQSLFFFTNSSTLGSALTYDPNTLTASNLFENGNFGLFLGSIQHTSNTLNVSSLTNSTCFGPIFSQNGVNVCTYVLPTRTGNYSLPYALLNSTYLTANYKINMYSLINNTEIGDVSPNIGNVIEQLKINANSVVWASPFKNSCQFDNLSIGCKFNNFDSSNYNASFTLTNNLPLNLTINKINCELAPGFANYTINKTIAPNSSYEIIHRCDVVAGPLASPETSYILLLNYTYNGSVYYTHGLFNVSSGN